ncbi:MAG TPA: FtsX-like permease family protein, partial [Bryobacteraceae bacterium]|nr:FtsX-like permease family protein [Bryobacteraceae bacterium]
NLLIARGTARAKEIAIRMAIGARRGILVRQFLTESLLIALLGGAAGIGVGVAGIRFLQSIPLPADFPLDLGLQIDGRLLAFTLLSAVATALIFGLLPALRATRSDLATTIKASDAGPARISLFRGIFSGRNILVTAQLALSVILLGVSVLCVRGFQIARNLDPGFRMDHTLFFSMNPNIQRFDEAKTRDFYKKLTDRLRAAGGVEEVSISSTIPFNAGPGSRNVMLDGVKQRAGEDTPTAWSNAVGEHYFDLMQTRILRGRAINAFDTATSPKVAVINETLANKFFPGQDPIGKQLRLDKPDGPLVQIVGVAKNGLYFYWAEPAQNAIFTPFSQDYNSQMDVEMRTSGDPASFAAAVRENVRALDPDMPIFRISTMTRFFDDRAMLGPRLIAQIVTATGFMGLIMAIVGLYGVVAYSVSRRTREIGIRMAIGATPRGIVRMVLTQGIALTVVGLALGIGLILLSKSALAFFIIGVSPYSPEVLVGVPVILALAMMIACFVPARRAASIDPTRALRLE